MSDLQVRYTGENATNYDAKRSKSRRWRNEISTMERFLDQIRPKVVLDCPFGTGRWIPQYNTINAEVIGIDLSDGMLKEARAKLDLAGSAVAERYILVEGNIFDLASENLPKEPDLVVCVRFVNWIPFEKVKDVIARQTALAAKEMIIGASLVPDSASRLHKAFYRWSLKWVNKRAAGKPAQYVHEEADMVGLFKEHGWKIVEQAEILRRSSRVNYFFHLKRG